MVKRFLVVSTVGLVLMLSSSFTEVLHKYYLSLTEVNINSEKNTLDVSSKMFTDDLELEIEKTTGKKISLNTSKDKATEKLVGDYLMNNFKVNVGGKLQKLEFIGFEIENESVWCYSEVRKFRGKGTISIMNTLLYGNFPEQSNLVNVNWDGKSESLKLTNPVKMGEFQFK